MKSASLLRYIMIPLVGAVLAGFLGNYILSRSYQRTEQERVFRELSDLMGKRMYYMRKLVDAYNQQKPKAEVALLWKEYGEVVVLWNASLSKNLGLVQRYFGDDAQKCFGDIHMTFRRIGSKLEYPYNNNMAVLRSELDALNERYHQFALGLSSAIGNWTIGSFDNRNCIISKAG